MAKTSNLRSELLDIQQANDKSFVISVAVWEAPGTKDAPHAIRFQFMTHKNPALWWRLTMTTARQKGTGRAAAKYTNSQYNKALRTATDAMNALIMRESDAGRKITPNNALPELPYGQMPNEVAFLKSVFIRFDTPLQFNMRFDSGDAIRVLRAAELCDAQVREMPDRTISVTSSRDLYKIIQSLWMMREEFGDEQAGDIASAMLDVSGFDWV